MQFERPKVERKTTTRVVVEEESHRELDLRRKPHWVVAEKPVIFPPS
jgi:hypothetical protein